MADPAKFVHLHVHSEYSILDGCMKIDTLVDSAAAMGLPAIALTDHGGMFGSVEFYEAARAKNIKPIIGVEAYVARGSKSVKTGGKEEQAGINHLVLLAKNEAGYKNLMKLVTTAYVDGFYYKPRMDKDDLAAHSEGLLCLSACISGEIPVLVLQNKMAEARMAVDRFKEIFGADNFFLEVQENTLPEQRQANERIIELARQTNTPLVATNDCHYARQTDADVHDILLCIQTNRRFDEPDRMKMSADQFFLKTPDQMAREFEYLPEALSNTLYVADMCDLQIDLKSKHMPTYDLPPEIKLNHKEYLRKLAYDGAKNRYADPIPQAVQERIDYELGIIETTGFESYFLIVLDIIQEAHRRGIPSGVRGSGNASVVAYSIGITDLEPMRYDLLFERLLNPERVSPPDFDIDLSDVRRHEIIEYIIGKYGADRVAQIATFARLGARQSVKDVGRALGMTVAECDRISKMIPEDPKITLEKALDEAPEIRQIANSDPQHRRLFEVALGLEGITRQTSIHAAGLIIADAELTNYTPLMRPKGGPLATQYEFGILEKMGMFKIDILGLKTLTQIDETCRLLRKRGIEIDPRKIPLDDAKTFKLLQDAHTNGVFQLESQGMKNVLRELGPTIFTDIIAVVALYRPGPMEMIPEFCQRKKGRIPIRYDLEELKPILSETYGIIVYQEQVMQIANKVAGMSLGGADIMRRAMGKKKPELLAEQKKVFVPGAVARGVPEKTANELFDLIEKFANYGFNKSHATAYSVVSFQTAYLKANYPVEFMAATLTNDMDDTDKILKYSRDAREMGLHILPPDINRSEAKFTAEEGAGGAAIRFGLGGIKNVGGAAVEAIINAREAKGPFKSLDDFCERVNLNAVNSKTLECLIRCGAFDSVHPKRAALLAAYPDAVRRSQSAQRDQEIGQGSLFAIVAEAAPATGTPLPDVPELPESERLQGEKELLGIYVTGHPLMKYVDDLKLFANATTQQLINKERDLAGVRLVGVITDVKQRKTRDDGKAWGVATFEDLEGTVEVTLFPENYITYGPYLIKDQVVVVEGDGRENADNISIIASRVTPIDTAREKLVQAVHVRLKSGADQGEILESLCATIRRYKGNARLKFHVRSPELGETVIDASDKFAVLPSRSFVESVEGLLAEKGAVSFDIASAGNGNNGRWQGRPRNGQPF